MILIPRWAAFVLLIVALGAIVALGVAGYRAVGSAVGSSATEVKARAEFLLYGSIVAAATLSFVLIGLLGRTEYLTRELDKMVELNRYGDFSPEVGMRKFGRMGEKITALYHRLNALNEKRSVKISALSGLVHLLTNNLESPVLITDVAGQTLYANRRLCETVGRHRSELLGTNIDDLLESSNVQDVVSRLDRGGAPHHLSGESTPIAVIPVGNRRNEISYIVWSFEKEGLSVEGVNRPETRSRRGGIHRFFRQMLAPADRERRGP